MTNHNSTPPPDGTHPVSQPVDQLARQGTRSLTELENVARRALELPYRRRLELVRTLEKSLSANLQPSPLTAQVERREHVVQALDKAAAWLGLAPGRRITSTQFKQVSAKLGLGVTVQEAAAAFDRWRWAVDAYLGLPVPLTSATRALKRATAGRARSFEDHLYGVRRWLDTDPACLRMQDYDGFAAEYNQTLADGGAPLVRAATITHQLAIRWPEVLAVAAGKKTIDQLALREVSLPDADADVGALVGITSVARLLDVGIPQAGRMTRRQAFPPPQPTSAVGYGFAATSRPTAPGQSRPASASTSSSARSRRSPQSPSPLG